MNRLYGKWCACMHKLSILAIEILCNSNKNVISMRFLFNVLWLTFVVQFRSMPLVSMCLLLGGRRSSLYSDSASRNARDTSRDVVVVHSINNGYNPINLSHANASTEK